MALLFGGVMLLIGAALLTCVFLVVQSTMGPLPQETTTLVFSSDGGGPSLSGLYEQAVKRVYLEQTQERVRGFGGLVVLAATLIAAAAGWQAAGWALRPARRVTVAARRVALSHDLTERIGYDGPDDEIRQLADIFDGVLGRLVRAQDGQRRFIANASHELRTPLTVNRTLVDVAVRRAGAGDEVVRLGESLLVVNERHERLIDGLLALAQGEQALTDTTAFDLADVVDHVVDLGAAEALDREVTVVHEVAEAPTEGDPVLVERLVQNLFENAVRHNAPGGRAWLTTRAAGAEVELTVENTGPVVPAYEVETIFQPFRRRSERGTGLGLSIVRAITTAHGGTVAARPREDGGLAVTVRLPRTR
ncbi:sensor histidine kinase [Herbidospora daliensis]|uniref:sensor histidine kinase n=1 Tax=Herbidospora daliensis TaxID=295585 RepID=UPI0007C67224|nr:HAMP domain-containing sensor histidine kinase [Herbidospora daliensis]